MGGRECGTAALGCAPAVRPPGSCTAEGGCATLSLRPRWLSALGIAACIIAGAFTLALSVRPTDTVDLGYHLAYGQRFLDTGHIVNDDSLIYPRITPAGVKPADMPPGSWFDAQGHYRFINANWLTQILMAVLWRLGGWTAMNATMIVLVAIIMAAQAAALVRFAASVAQPPSADVAQPPSAVRLAAAGHLRAFWPAWLAGVWLATGVIGHERFMLRPELFSFACLAVQLWLLAGRITWPRIVGFAAVQLLAVNLHSYWLLGVGLVGAFWADAAARWVWTKWVTLKPLDDAARQRLLRLTIALAATIPAAMLHPAGPANATFPLRTLSYLKRFDVSGLSGKQIAAEWREGTMHPWASIGEFSQPLTAGQWVLRSSKAWLVLLAAGVPAAIALAWRRRWGHLLLLVALAAASVSMRRNIVIFPFLAGPIVAAALADLWSRLRMRGGDPQPPARWWTMAVPAAAAAVVLALGLWWLVGIATNRFYDSERKLWTLGLGVSRMNIPLGPCQWLDEHLPIPQPIFTDQPNSSSVAFFSKKVTGVPVLTNTWAMPADRFDTLLRLCAGRQGLEQLDAWGFDVAVIRVWPSTRELVVKLLMSSEPALALPRERQWALVYAETSFMVFVRRSAATAEMLQHEITPATFDTRAFADLCRLQHPVAALALKDGAVMLQSVDEAFIPFRATQQEASQRDPRIPPPTRADWLAPTEQLWRQCLAAPPGDRFHEAWLNLGVCLARHSIRQRVAGDAAGSLTRLREARDCFAHALALKRDYVKARLDLARAEADLRQLQGPTEKEKQN